MKHLADEFVPMITSPSPQDVFCYSPGIARLASGRLIGTMDFGGPGVSRMAGSVGHAAEGNFQFLGKAFLSDDGGSHWEEKATFSMFHMRPFEAGGSVYVIGHHTDLCIARSDDGGETWSAAVDLTHGQYWHQAPCNVWYKDDFVYLVMERMTHQRTGWPVCGIAPVLMRGNIHTDLTLRKNWTFASELVFDENIDENSIPEWGIPFYPPKGRGYGRNIPLGWLETNVVQLLKPNDRLYDPTEKTFHLFMRTWTGLAWTGAVIKVVEQDDGSMVTQFECAPSGKRLLYTPIPGGGQSKFHILYDKKTKTYWLLSNQFVDSMVNMDQMTRHQQRGYDRSRLVLHYSYNCFDWIFAGVVAAGNTLRQARSYASMAIDCEDLAILCRTGDEYALSGHDTNIISFHRVRDFRKLIDCVL